MEPEIRIDRIDFDDIDQTVTLHATYIPNVTLEYITCEFTLETEPRIWVLVPKFPTRSK